MPRFFIDETEIQDDIVSITGEDVKHIKNVLRLSCGSTIVLSDGKHNDYLVKIEDFQVNLIRTRIINSIRNTTEPQIDITLYQGLPKSDKMDFIIQKSIELGVKKIVPVTTERTIVKISNKSDAESKVKRWQRIALEAAKQCNRGIIPEIGFPIDFEAALKFSKDADMSLIPYEKETQNNLRENINKAKIEGTQNISVIIGPEGGFSENEIEKAIGYNIKPVSLGPRILRTETAGIAIVSILMYELGDVSV